MAYEIFKKRLSREAYFKDWKDDSHKAMNQMEKDVAYEKYIMRCDVFGRDDFTCQNIDCPFCHNEKYYSRETVKRGVITRKGITNHHVIPSSEGGLNVKNNGVTLCHTIHQGYEKAKHSFVLSKELSNTLTIDKKGEPYKLNKPHKTNFKQKLAEAKKFRKSLKSEYGIVLTWEQVLILMTFLYKNFSDD